MGLEKKGKIEKIVNVILNIFIGIFSVILLISLYNNVQVKLFGKDYSDFFGYSIFEVQTGSMQPEINPGDWIIVKSSQNIKLKDVFKIENAIKLGYLVEKDDYLYIPEDKIYIMNEIINMIM